LRFIIYENGEIARQTPYANDARNGLEREYCENGNPKKETLYKSGREEGFARVYYEDGSVKTESPIKNRKRDGILKRYFKNSTEIQIHYKEGVITDAYCIGSKGRRALKQEEQALFLRGEKVECGF
jgi:antitoxin component YwqK of YwqJK toxin-antitoxin module